jgi:ribonucleoside-diphosphate reductase alpha chain
MTTYRPNSITGSILSVEEASELPEPQGVTLDESLLAPRAEALPGTTYKLRWPESAHAIYVTINDIETGGIRRPFEIFINSKNTEHYAWSVGLTRMISAVFRRSADVSFVAEELKAVFDPRGGAWMLGRYVPSLHAAIGDIIERHIGAREAELPIDLPHAPTMQRPPRCCPRCGAAAMMRSEGCETCLECGHSKCG